jgi:predicted HicB family RNase H-like nuclease
LIHTDLVRSTSTKDTTEAKDIHAFSLRVPYELHKAAALLAIERRVSHQSLWIEAMRRFLKLAEKPNKAA